MPKEETTVHEAESSNDLSDSQNSPERAMESEEREIYDFQEEMKSEKSLAERFIQGVSLDDKEGITAAQEMKSVIRDISSLEESWYSRVSKIVFHPIKEFQEYRTRAREKELSQLDNPKIWKEMRKQEREIEIDINAIWLQARDKKKRKEKKEYVEVKENEVHLTEKIINKAKNFLADYRSFHKSQSLSSSDRPYYDIGMRLSNKIINNFLSRGEIDKALEIWSLSPDGNTYYAERINHAVSDEFQREKPFHVFRNEQSALGMPDWAIHDKRNQEHYAFFRQRLKDFPELLAVNFREMRRYRDVDKEEFFPDQIQILRELSANPERLSFIRSFSPFKEALREAMPMDVRSEIFHACFEGHLDIIIDNKRFFANELSALTPEQRNRLFDQLTARIQYLYGKGYDYVSRYYVPPQEYVENEFVFEFFELLRVTKEEQQRIYDSLLLTDDSMEGHERNSSKSKKDRSEFKKKIQRNAYDKFLGDMLAYHPKALTENAEVFLGFEYVNDAANFVSKEDQIADRVMLQNRSFLVYKLFENYSNTNYRHGSQIHEKHFGVDRAVSLVEYIMKENSPDGIGCLLRNVNDFNTLPLPTELIQKFIDLYLQNFDENRCEYILDLKKESKLHFDHFSPEQKSVFLEKIYNINKKGYKLADIIEKCIPFFDSIPNDQEEKFTDFIIQNSEDRNLSRFFDVIGATPKSEESFSRKSLAVRSYVRSAGITDQYVIKKYIDYFISNSSEAAEEYIKKLKEKARDLLADKPAYELRETLEYEFLVKYIFPQGNYSDYEKNLACGDRLDHLKGYQYSEDGYPTELSGLLGYRLKPGSPENPDSTLTLQDDTKLLHQYEGRFKKVNEFIGSRGPDNKELRRAFDEKVSGLFAGNAAKAFLKIGGLTAKEKMLCLFISEVIRRQSSDSFEPRHEILDLVVEYKYAYHENLENYIHRSADDIERQRDDVSKRFLLWQELSTIYGENVKHVLRHDIFEDLRSESKNYDKIVSAFGASLSAPSEVFSLGPREIQGIEAIFKRRDSPEEKYRFVIEKLADLYGPQLKLKGDEEKQKLQQEKYTVERAKFVTRLKELMSPHISDLNPILVGEIMSRGFSINPKQLARFDNTFENDQIPVEDTIVDGKLKDGKKKVLMKQVLDMFGSNLRFREDEERKGFEADIYNVFEELEGELDKTSFLQCIPKFQAIRNQYRFGVNAKLEELFSLDINAINQEIAKFEEIIEVENKEISMGGQKDKSVKKSGKKRKVRTFITKTQETANARMGAYLCIAGDTKMWENEYYLEAVDKDEETGKCVGLTMYLEIPTEDGKKYLWIGPNPFESFLTQVSSEKCLDHQYGVAVDFAQRNGFDGIVVPPEDGQILGQCTNRGGNFPDLIKAKRLRNPRGELQIIDFGKTHILGSSYGYSSGALVWKKG